MIKSIHTGYIYQKYEPLFKLILLMVILAPAHWLLLTFMDKHVIHFLFKYITHFFPPPPKKKVTIHVHLHEKWLFFHDYFTWVSTASRGMNSLSYYAYQY